MSRDAAGFITIEDPLQDDPLAWAPAAWTPKDEQLTFFRLDLEAVAGIGWAFSNGVLAVYGQDMQLGKVAVYGVVTLTDNGRTSLYEAAIRRSDEEEITAAFPIAVGPLNIAAPAAVNAALDQFVTALNAR